MTVWTIQPCLALAQINADWIYRCDKKKSFNLTKPDSLKPAYLTLHSCNVVVIYPLLCKELETTENGLVALQRYDL